MRRETPYFIVVALAQTDRVNAKIWIIPLEFSQEFWLVLEFFLILNHFSNGELSETMFSN